MPFQSGRNTGKNVRFAAGRRFYLFPTAHYFDGLTKGFDANLDAVPRVTESERVQGPSLAWPPCPLIQVNHAFGIWFSICAIAFRQPGPRSWFDCGGASQDNENQIAS